MSCILTFMVVVILFGACVIAIEVLTVRRRNTDEEQRRLEEAWRRSKKGDE